MNYRPDIENFELYLDATFLSNNLEQAIYGFVHGLAPDQLLTFRCSIPRYRACPVLQKIDSNFLISALVLKPRFPSASEVARSVYLYT